MLWKMLDKDVPKDELPALRSVSDVAWGLWNRQSVENIRNIRGFMSIMVMNEETEEIIERAMALRFPGEPVPVDEWPGTDFSTAEEAGQALLGKSSRNHFFIYEAF